MKSNRSYLGDGELSIGGGGRERDEAEARAEKGVATPRAPRWVEPFDNSQQGNVQVVVFEEHDPCIANEKRKDLNA